MMQLLTGAYLGPILGWAKVHAHAPCQAPASAYLTGGLQLQAWRHHVTCGVQNLHMLVLLRLLENVLTLNP